MPRSTEQGGCPGRAGTGFVRSRRQAVCKGCKSFTVETETAVKK